MPKLRDLIPEKEHEAEGLDKLTPAQQKAISALLISRTLSEAAEAAEVHRTTVYRWLRQDRNFRTELRRARREFIGETTAHLQRLSGEAVENLGKIVKDEKASAASRVSSIRIILDYAYRAVELEDLEDRLDGVEEAMDKYGS